MAVKEVQREQPQPLLEPGEDTSQLTPDELKQYQAWLATPRGAAASLEERQAKIQGFLSTRTGDKEGKAPTPPTPPTPKEILFANAERMRGQVDDAYIDRYKTKLGARLTNLSGDALELAFDALVADGANFFAQARNEVDAERIKQRNDDFDDAYDAQMIAPINQAILNAGPAGKAYLDDIKERVEQNRAALRDGYAAWYNGQMSAGVSRTRLDALGPIPYMKDQWTVFAGVIAPEDYFGGLVATTSSFRDAMRVVVDNEFRSAQTRAARVEALDRSLAALSDRFLRMSQELYGLDEQGRAEAQAVYDALQRAKTEGKMLADYKAVALTIDPSMYLDAIVRSQLQFELPSSLAAALAAGGVNAVDDLINQTGQARAQAAADVAQAEAATEAEITDAVQGVITDLDAQIAQTTDTDTKAALVRLRNSVASNTNAYVRNYAAAKQSGRATSASQFLQTQMDSLTNAASLPRYTVPAAPAAAQPTVPIPPGGTPAPGQTAPAGATPAPAAGAPTPGATPPPGAAPTPGAAPGGFGQAITTAQFLRNLQASAEKARSEHARTGDFDLGAVMQGLVDNPAANIDQLLATARQNWAKGVSETGQRALSEFATGQQTFQAEEGGPTARFTPTDVFGQGAIANLAPFFTPSAPGATTLKEPVSAANLRRALIGDINVPGAAPLSPAEIGQLSGQPARVTQLMQSIAQQQRLDLSKPFTDVGALTRFNTQLSESLFQANTMDERLEQQTKAAGQLALAEEQRKQLEQQEKARQKTLPTPVVRRGTRR